MISKYWWNSLFLLEHNPSSHINESPWFLYWLHESIYIYLYKCFVCKASTELDKLCVSALVTIVQNVIELCKLIMVLFEKMWAPNQNQRAWASSHIQTRPSRPLRQHSRSSASSPLQTWPLSTPSRNSRTSASSPLQISLPIPSRKSRTSASSPLQTWPSPTPNQKSWMSNLPRWTPRSSSPDQTPILWGRPSPYTFPWTQWNR